VAHELAFREDGLAAMAYTGETPWHGLGQQLVPGASIEDWQAAAGMDWKIQRAVVRFATAHGMTPADFSEFPDKHVLLRSDTKAALGIVSDGFQIVQPAAVLEFFRDLTDAAGYELTTAGVLFAGRRFWAMARTPDASDVGGSKITRNLLLSTACDGTMATEARDTSIVVVCNNTLSMARQGKAAYRLTHRTKFDPALCKRELGIDAAHEAFETTMAGFRRLADTRLLPKNAMMQTAELIRPGAAELAKAELIKVLDSKPVARINALAIENRQIGAEYSGMDGTQWGWLNAVTQYVDHESRARSVDNRLSSAWFGKGDATKTAAYAVALEASNSSLLESMLA
jgi:phage/plasmid-like protein (TIGR03299 family)